VTQPTNEITISLRDVVQFVLRGLIWAVLFGGIAGGAAYFLAQRESPVFRAEATLLVARTTGGFSQFGLSPVTAPPIDLSAYRAAAASDRVLSDTASILGVADVDVGTIRSLRGATNTFIAGDGRDSSLLGVEARASTPAVAVARANAHAAALVEWDRRRATESLNRVITTLEQQIEALGEQIRAVQAAGDGATQTQVDGLIRLRADQQQQLAYARALVASAEGLLSVMQGADTSPRQIAPRPVMSALVAALIAGVLAYAFLLVRTALNTRLRSVDDIATASGLGVLAQFPRSGGASDAWRIQEAANYLRTNLLFALSDVHPKVILVTSANEAEGKTTVSCQLAEGLARNGYRTLLVDADLRSPSVADHFDIVGTGATTTTTREWMRPATNNKSVLKVMLDDADLYVVPQFQSVGDAAEALGRGFPAALEQWKQYDVIVIDSSPILAVADALAIAPRCSGTILVVDAQRSQPASIVRARELLDSAGANVLGVVANHVRQGSSNRSYGATYGTGYGRPAPAAAPAGRGIARPHVDSVTSVGAARRE
jgi:capsular exopolysaccharide synthesis family protein